MKRWQQFFVALLAGVGMLVGLGPVLVARAAEPQVRAVLFFSPTCGHCHKVISEDLPPLFETYGNQLNIFGVDISQDDGQELYLAAIERFDIERQGVPTLIVGDVVLIGSGEIPQRFPNLIESYLAQGGVDWPDIPGLAAALESVETPEAAPPEPTVQPTPTIPASGEDDDDEGAIAPVPPTPPTQLITPETGPGSGLQGDTPSPAETGLRARLSRDPVGNTLAIVVMVGMVVVLGVVAATFRREPAATFPAWQQWAIPLLALVGLGVAVYLVFIETTDVLAICGPVGDCNTVQQSEYAKLFGVVPVGALGVAGYVVILLVWLVGRVVRGTVSHIAWLALSGTTLIGTLFSLYLTFLEPFVIGATCLWCLTSAVVMTLLFWLTAPRGKEALASLKAQSRE
jgi:uncharacterized membrane protein/thiol-disulfide isomerase/thioredoxin